jgi:esterase/lipase superfamily enzyme
MGSSEAIQYGFDKDLRNGDAECLSLLESIIDNQQAFRALIFIHGYRVSAEDAVKTAIAFALDVHYSGVVIVWSWPSDAIALDYARDEETALAIAPRIGTFFSALFREKNHIKFDLMAHSLGSRILLQSLTTLVAEGQLKIIDSIVFAAPDVAQDIFESQLSRLNADSHGTIYKLATLYASDQDHALLLSTRVHGGTPRAGSGGSNILVMSGIESVDASTLSSIFSFNHSYIFEDTRAIRDFGAALVDQRTASERRLEERVKRSIKYWLLR